MVTDAYWNKEIKSSTDRAFCGVFFILFLILGVGPLVRSKPISLPFLGVAGLFFLVGVFRPGLAAPLNRAWAKLGFLLQKLVTPIVMGVLYFCVFTPIGVVLRLTGRDLLGCKFDHEARSYWKLSALNKGGSVSMKFQF